MMDPLTIKNDKAVLRSEPLIKTIQHSIFNIEEGTSQIYNLTPAEATRLAHHLMDCAIAIATEDPSLKSTTR